MKLIDSVRELVPLILLFALVQPMTSSVVCAQNAEISLIPIPPDYNETHGALCQIDFWARNPAPNAVQSLLDSGADPNEDCEMGNRSPLVYALTEESPAYANLLIAGGADTTQNQLLAIAAHSQGPDLVAFFVDQGIDVSSVGFQNQTPIFAAVYANKVENILALLEAGADVNHRDVDGLMPLHIAALHGTPETVMALLEAGAIGYQVSSITGKPYGLASTNRLLSHTDALEALRESQQFVNRFTTLSIDALRENN